MNSDLVVFLSGWIPLGIYLPLMAGIFLSIIWLVVWAGTRFWERRLLWKNFIRLWTLVLIGYFAFWIANPAPPIPQRIIIIESPPDSSTWQARGVAALIRDGLSRTQLPYALLDNDMCAGVASAPDSRTFEQAALKARIKWLIRVLPEQPNLVTVNILKAGSGGYQSFAKLQRPVEFFRRDGAPLAAEALKALGEKKPPAISTFLPSFSTDSTLAILFAPIDYSDSSNAGSLDRLRTLTSTWPDWQAARLLTAKALIQADLDWNRYEIQTQLEEAGKLDPRSPETMTLLGLIFLESRQWERAESALELSYNLDPNNPRALFYLSRLKNQRLDDLQLDTDLELLERALYLAGGYEDARLELAKYYMLHEQKQFAMNTLNEGLEYNPRSVSLRLSLSATLLEYNKLAESIELCQEILSLKPDFAPAYYNLGVALIYNKQYREGIAALDNSLFRGGTVDNIYYKGVAYQKMGEWENAIFEFQKRMALLTGTDDRVFASARERVKTLRRWIAERDSGKTDSNSRVEE